MGLFDVHAHLTSPQLAPQEEILLTRAAEAGLTTIISNGLNPADNQAVLALSERSTLVKPAFGLYPVDAVLHEMEALGVDYHRDGDMVPTADTCVAWVRDHLDEAFAVGEIGLDHYWVPEPLWARQEEVFRQLVSLAMEADKAIIVHTRKAEVRALQVLQEMGAPKVDWHCFSSKVKLGRRIGAHGHWLSIPAHARRTNNFCRLIETLPRDKVLLETDCPYLSPARGELNEPANVTHTVALMGELWGCDEEAVEAQLEENFEALFGVRP